MRRPVGRSLTINVNTAVEAEKHIQPPHRPRPLEDGGAGLGVEAEAFHCAARTIGRNDLYSRRPGLVSHHGHLTSGECQRAGLEFKAALLAPEIVEVERPRLRQELATAHQVGAEAESSAFDFDPHLAEPRDEILFHLAGHAGLLHSRETWRVGIRIGRHGAVDLRWLVDADALSDLDILAPEAFDNCGVLAGARGAVGYLLNREQELGNHVRC